MPSLSHLVPALVLVLVFCAGDLSSSAAQEGAKDSAQLATENPQGPTEPLTIVTASGPHKFAVEVMRTPAELERGLMFRRAMPADHGMIFDFKTVQPVMMWMRNTYIPLDMVFIAPSGKVVSVGHGKPLSDHIIHSGGPVLGVLEVNAGTAAKIGLKPGDTVVFPLFAK